MVDVVEAVRAAFPGRNVELEGEGQLSSAFRVDEELIVRVPRHAYGVERLRFEVGILNLIRDRLEVAVPDIIDVALDLPVGRAYVSHRRIPGRILRREDVSALTPDGVDKIASQVGRFLRNLHSIDLADVAGAGVKVLTASAFAAELKAEVRARLAPLVDSAQLDGLYRSLAQLETVADKPLVLAHTDIGGNIVVDERGNVGIIDFGSCFATHPAFDRASLSVLGANLTDAVAATYPPLAAFPQEATAIASTFFLQDALYAARQEDWPYVRAMFGLPD